MKFRRILRLALLPIIKPGSGDVRMAQPLLDLGDVRLVSDVLYDPLLRLW